MATLTVTLDPAVLEAATREAERRQITVEELVAQTLSAVPANEPLNDHGHANLVRLMARAPFGELGKPLTRDEIYAERTWPRS